MPKAETSPVKRLSADSTYVLGQAEDVYTQIKAIAV
jgi:hypothetical protein